MVQKNAIINLYPENANISIVVLDVTNLCVWNYQVGTQI